MLWCAAVGRSTRYTLENKKANDQHPLLLQLPYPTNRFRPTLLLLCRLSIGYCCSTHASTLCDRVIDCFCRLCFLLILITPPLFLCLLAVFVRGGTPLRSSSFCQIVAGIVAYQKTASLHSMMLDILLLACC